MMDAHFNEGLGFAENKSDLPFNQHRVERKLARELSKRASKAFDPSQADEQTTTFIKGLKSKFKTRIQADEIRRTFWWR